MDSQNGHVVFPAWWLVRTTHESGQRVESRRFGYDAVERYIDQCIDEYGPLAEPVSIEIQHLS